MVLCLRIFMETGVTVSTRPNIYDIKLSWNVKFFFIKATFRTVSKRDLSGVIR